MTIWRVQGGTPLEGSLRVQGAKNAMLPILAASILVPGETELLNCPELSDRAAALAILRCLGCETREEGDCVTVSAAAAAGHGLPAELSGTMRASLTFLGPALARFGEASMTFPGGCPLGRRPVNLHIYALRCLGAEVTETEKQLRCRAAKLTGGEIHFPVSSVGATENAMLAACGAQGTTVIHGAAREPEIVDLQRFLRRCGFSVSGAGSPVIAVEGGSPRHRVGHRVMPDRIAAATYLCAAAITGGDVEVWEAPPEDQGPVLTVLGDMGCRITTAGRSIRLRAPGQLRSPGTLTARPYPGFPTDALPLFTALAAAATGSTRFRDTVFESRYRHLPGLAAMGARTMVDGREAVIRGGKLRGSNVAATDLRGAAALLLAGLRAQGETRLTDSGHLDRGYMGLEQGLVRLGAQLTREIRSE